MEQMPSDIRSNWTFAEAMAWMTGPLASLKARAQELHEKYAAKDVQRCMLLSVKTGACPEDCGYCSQSAHFKTGLEVEPLAPVSEVLKAAVEAKEVGATRFCMGAAWRDVPTDRRFTQVLEMIQGVSKMGLEVCCTMGMASEDQLKLMKLAGLTAYNHNVDTSREYYSEVTTTRTYDDRLNTLKAVRKSGAQICSGGILGMGEAVKDRVAMLVELASFDPHPESVPVNLLVPIEGTPMEKVAPVPFEDFLRTIALARVMMPKTRVRLSAGRNTLTEEQQLECFSVGANSIFIGEKLLTAPNVPIPQDEKTLNAFASV